MGSRPVVLDPGEQRFCAWMNTRKTRSRRPSKSTSVGSSLTRHSARHTSIRPRPTTSTFLATWTCGISTTFTSKPGRKVSSHSTTAARGQCSARRASDIWLEKCLCRNSHAKSTTTSVFPASRNFFPLERQECSGYVLIIKLRKQHVTTDNSTGRLQTLPLPPGI